MKITRGLGSVSVASILSLAAVSAVRADTIVLQQGVNGYAGGSDNNLTPGDPDTFRSATGVNQMWVDGSTPDQIKQVLLRFDGIPQGVTITSATLTLTTAAVTDAPGFGGTFYRMLQPWTGADTWNSLGSGIQNNGVEASSTASVTAPSSSSGTVNLNVTADVQGWANGQANYGWAELSNNSDGWAVYTTTFQTITQRPKLTITFTPNTHTETWTDATNNHTFNTTSLNWNSGTPYAEGDSTVFNDTGAPGHYNVNIPAAVNPGVVSMVNNAGDYVFSGTGAIAGGKGARLVKYGTGMLTVSTASQSSFKSGISLFQGTVVLNLAAIASHTDILTPDTDVQLGGGGLRIVGNPVGISSQTVTSSQAVAGASSISIDSNGGSGVNLTFKASIRSTGATIDIATIPAGSTINASWVDDGFVTYNKTDWINSPGAGTVPTSITAFTAYTNNTWAAGNHTDVTTSQTLPPNPVTSHLRYNLPVDTTLTIPSGSGSITSGGILMTANVGAHNNLITGASLLSNNGQDVIVHQYDPQGSLTIASIIVPSPGANNPTGLTTTGPGTVVVTGNNTFSGFITVNGSVLSVPTLPNGGTSSPLGNSSNAAVNVTLNGGGTLRYTGTGASTDRLFTLGPGGGAISSSGTGPLTFNNSNAIAFAQDCPVTLTLTGSNINTNVFTPSIADPDATSTYTTSLVKNGVGLWLLAHSSSFSGGTTINGGSLVLAAPGSAGTGPLAVNNPGSALIVNPGISTVGAISDNAGLVSLSGNSSGAISQTNAATLAINSGAVMNNLISADHSRVILNNSSIGGSASLTGGTMSGAGAIAGVTTLSGGAHVAPQSTLQLNTLILNAGTQMDATFSTPAASSALNSPTALTLNPAFQANVTAAAPFGTGNYKLMQYGALNDNSSHFQNWITNVNWPAAPAGTYYTFANDSVNKNINLVVGSTAGVYPLDPSGTPTGIPANPSGNTAVGQLPVGNNGWIVGPVNSTGGQQTWNFSQQSSPPGQVPFRTTGNAVIPVAPIGVVVTNKPGPGLFVGAFSIQTAPINVAMLFPGATPASVNTAIANEQIGLGWMNTLGSWIAAVDGNFFLGNGNDPMLGNVPAGFSANAFTGPDPLSVNPNPGALTSREVNLSLDDYIGTVFGAGFNSNNLTPANWTALDGAWGGAPDLTVDPTGNTYRFWAVVDYDAQFAPFVVVPEPASVLTFGIGTAGLLLRRRRK